MKNIYFLLLLVIFIPVIGDETSVQAIKEAKVDKYDTLHIYDC